MPDFRMNSLRGEAVLAPFAAVTTRPGAEEAIAPLSRMIDRTRVRRTLDVGCGHSGTAVWFQRHGCAAVTGVDLDETSIHYGRGRYPYVSFLHAKVARLTELAIAPFDLIDLFNA